MRNRTWHKLATDVVIDDHLLFAVLQGEEPADLRPAGGRIWTTGLWYHRLCRALTGRETTGRLSGKLGSLSDEAARATIAALVELPEEIGLISLRTLGLPMARLLAEGHRLNLMSLEAAASAQELSADICLAAEDENPPLLAAAAELAIPTRLLNYGATLAQATLPRGTTHRVGWPVMAAIRSKSAS